MTQEILELAVLNGFYKNDAGTITSPYIEDVDISELLLDFADDVIKAERNRLADELQKMPLNDTANSIAIWIRGQE